MVIPTTNRPTLGRAVASALAQTGIDLEVLVVMNGSGPSPRFDDPRVRVLRSDPIGRGNLARQTGIDEAQHDLIALLDDDDWWDPRKTELQIQAAEALGLGTDDKWLSITATYRVFDGTPATVVWPTRPFGEITDVAHYLFRRTRARTSGQTVQSSTFLAPRSFAATNRFDPSIIIHQDWAWAIRAVATNNAKLVPLSAPLAYRDVSTSSSMTSQSRWRDSYEWGQTLLSSYPRPLIGDFNLTVPLPLAASEKDWRGVFWILSRSIGRRSPSFWASVSAIKAIAVHFARPARLEPQG
ncbi:glycosyltransferase family 2 protein [Cryobacterium arcticum]|uniref:glycosyltransferase n=1 Tax=Cryobacterium arcticum TaxID=670052 RepID=UPI001431D903